MRNLKEAQSYQNGIAFYSSILPDVFVYSYYDEENIIQSTKYTEQARNIALPVKETKKEKSDIKSISIIISIFIMSLAAISGKINFIISAFVFSMLVIENFIYLFHDFKKFHTKYKNTGRTLAKFHGAEHMAANAYEKYERIPTLEEIRKASRFSDRCGSMIRIRKVVNFSLTALIILTYRAFGSSTYFILIALAVLFGMLEARFGFFKFLEVFFVSKPSDEELLLAIHGLQQFEKMEEVFEEKRKKFGKINFRFDGETGEFMYFSDREYEQDETW